VWGVGCGSIRWEGEKIHNSTGSRVGLRAWDICEEMGVSGRARGVGAREVLGACKRCWGTREVLGA